MGITVGDTRGFIRAGFADRLSMAMRKSPLVARSRSPLVAR